MSKECISKGAEQKAMNGDSKGMSEDKRADLTPKEIVARLDQYIIGQDRAKRAVAIVLRNRYRRLKLSEDIRGEVAPKNILMIGPTGVGKTEIARRLARLCGAPFVKVEATKYTEVGYVGRDVESMVRDLMAVGYTDVKSEMEERLREKSVPIVEEKLLDLLLPGTDKKKKKRGSKKEEISMQGLFEMALETDEQGCGASKGEHSDGEKASDAGEEAVGRERAGDIREDDADDTREKFRKMLRDGKLEEREVEIVVRPQAAFPSMEIIAGGSLDELQGSMQSLMGMLSGRGARHRTISVQEARKIITEEVLDSMVDTDKVAEEAKQRVEQSGIIFIDEIDKIATKTGESHGQDVSREGVQRDILPIVEGSSVNTRYGVVDTTHILFIAAGAFSVASPSDLIPELQGRFPLRVELDALKKDDFRRILTEPRNALTKQYTALLATENVTIDITDGAIDRMASLAEEVNSRDENIGARRLHTIMEKVLDDISFSADEHSGETITIDEKYVDEKLIDIVKDTDVSRYIL